MMKNIAMLVLSVGVAGAMAFILIRFLRRLKQVEIDMWGEKARAVEEARQAKAAARKAKAAEEKDDAPAGT